MVDEPALPVPIPGDEAEAAKGQQHIPGTGNGGGGKRNLDSPKRPASTLPPGVAGPTDHFPSALPSGAPLDDSRPRALPAPKLYQDEIYGSKELSPLAVCLLDTPEVQRLGHIYQLGMTFNVFRGATHLRLDHSVGTYFMVRTLLRRIVQNHARLHSGSPSDFPHPGYWVSPRYYMRAPGTKPSEQKEYSPMGKWRGLVEVISAAALLHDVSHVAAGHTMEDEFSILEKHDGIGNSRLFELLYGPRSYSGDPGAPTRAGRAFGPIDETALEKPRPQDERVSLPWVFEEGTYVPFLPNAEAGSSAAVAALSNPEIRDILYLVLSFKERIDGEIQQTFGDLLEKALGDATDEDQAARVQYIKDLYADSLAPEEITPDEPPFRLFDPFMADVVSNTICADILDYLVRDGSRLKLDIRANPRLQRYLVVRSARFSDAASAAGDDRTARRVAIHAVKPGRLPRRDTVSDLIDLMRERFRFAEVVYYHPKKCAFSTMFAKALELCDAGTRPRDGGGIYPAPWSRPGLPKDGVPHIGHLGDQATLAYLERAADNPAVAELVRRIRYRDEYRLLHTLDYTATESGGPPDDIIDRLRTSRDAGRRHLERRFADLVGRSPDMMGALGSEVPVLVYCPNVKMQAKAVAAQVELTEGQVVPLNRLTEDTALRGEIDILSKKYKALWRLYLFVHPGLRRAAKDHPDGDLLLSGVVDLFFSFLGRPVGDDARRAGAAFRYLPLSERLQPYFDDFAHTFGRAPVERIRGVAYSKGLWQGVIPGEASVPVDEVECKVGFLSGAGLVSLDSAPQRARDQWHPAIREFALDDWLRPSDARGREELRRRGLDRVKRVAKSRLQELGERRNKSLAWRSLEADFRASLDGMT